MARVPLGHRPRHTISRVAKIAPEIPPKGSLDPFTVSTTFLYDEGSQIHEYAGSPQRGIFSRKNTAITFSVKNTGSNSVYLSWGTNHVNRLPYHVTLSTLEVPPGDTREFTGLLTMAAPFHLLTETGESTCIVDTFIQRNT